jgi:hypothetical protein
MWKLGKIKHHNWKVIVLMEVHVTIWKHEGGINLYMGGGDCDF